MDLELVETEVFVGSYRADLLAKQAGTENKVIIENQYGNTDHSHLGQLITYAAGLGSSANGSTTIIWIAEKFTEPHRAAMDWLNQCTSDGTGFYAIELQLWRIGDSAFAPRFNVVSRPNSFQKQLSRQAEALSETEKLYMEFWAGFVAFCGPDTTLKLASALPRYYLTSAIGRSGFGVNFTASKRNQCMERQLWMEGDNAKGAFQQLLSKKQEIVAALGPETQFNELPGRKASSILEGKPWDIAKRDEWPSYFQWLKQKGEDYVRIFKPLVAHLPLN